MLLYNELADWWPLISAPSDYAEEASAYTDALAQACNPRRVLELGSGGGNNASHMKRHFELTLCDLSPGMLEVSRRLNPECEHVQGDMRTVDLGRQFDAVFIHDAIMYLTRVEDLRAAIANGARHCRPGGAVLLAPDCFAENFVEATSQGGHDGDGRSARYIEWEYAGAGGYWADFVFMLREGDQPARIVHDRHQFGLFPQQVWLDACRAARLQPVFTQPPHSEVGHLETILARNPA